MDRELPLTEGRISFSDEKYRKFAYHFNELMKQPKFRLAEKMAIDEALMGDLLFGIKPDMDDISRRVNAKLDLMGIE